jgi:hypothetical protein
MTENFRLTKRAKEWIAGIRSNYESERAAPEARPEVEEKAEVAGFKFL